MSVEICIFSFSLFIVQMKKVALIRYDYKYADLESIVKYTTKQARYRKLGNNSVKILTKSMGFQKINSI